MSESATDTPREQLLQRQGSAARAVALWRVALFSVVTLVALGAAFRSAGDGEGPLLEWMTVGAVFLGSVVAGLAGFAFSAVTGSLILHWLTPATGVPLLLSCSVATQLLSIGTLWRTMKWRQCAPFLIGGFAGIPFGAFVLTRVNAHYFAAAFGLFLVAYSVYTLARPACRASAAGLFGDACVGFAGGITGGAIAFPGAIPTIWCSLRGLSKETQRGIVQPFILVMQIATLTYFSRLGILTSGTLDTFLLCAPAVLGGTWLGLHFFRRIDERNFRRIILLFLLISGGTHILT
jgi:uncharacterized membrane protein YfcA